MATVPSEEPLYNIPLVGAAWRAVTVPAPVLPGVVLPEATHSYLGRVTLVLACWGMECGVWGIENQRFVDLHKEIVDIRA